MDCSHFNKEKKTPIILNTRMLHAFTEQIEHIKFFFKDTIITL